MPLGWRGHGLRRSLRHRDRSERCSRSDRALQRRGALLAAVLALAFNLLFFWVRELPATVPIAATLLALEAWQRRSSRRDTPRPRPGSRVPATASRLRPQPKNTWRSRIARVDELGVAQRVAEWHELPISVPRSATIVPSARRRRRRSQQVPAGGEHAVERGRRAPRWTCPSTVARLSKPVRDSISPSRRCRYPRVAGGRTRRSRPPRASSSCPPWESRPRPRRRSRSSVRARDGA